MPDLECTLPIRYPAIEGQAVAGELTGTIIDAVRRSAGEPNPCWNLARDTVLYGLVVQFLLRHYSAEDLNLALNQPVRQTGTCYEQLLLRLETGWYLLFAYNANGAPVICLEVGSLPAQLHEILRINCRDRKTFDIFHYGSLAQKGVSASSAELALTTDFRRRGFR
jgi:hypothetical protein